MVLSEFNSLIIYKDNAIRIYTILYWHIVYLYIVIRKDVGEYCECYINQIFFTEKYSEAILKHACTEGFCLGLNMKINNIS